MCWKKFCRMCLFWSVRSTHLHRGLIIHPGRTRRRYFVSRFYAVIQLGNCAVFFITAYNVPGQMHRSPGWNLGGMHHSPGWNLGGYLRHLLWKRRKHKFCLHNMRFGSHFDQWCAKTLTQWKSNEKINNISVYVTVYASVASKTRILKTATHRHAVSDTDVFFIGHGKKGLCADFLGHAAGPENLMIIFFWPNTIHWNHTVWQNGLQVVPS